MAVATRITTWIAGDILTASALNGEFNNVITRLNTIDADNIDETDDYNWTGSHTFGSTSAKIDSTGVIKFAGSNTPGWTSNLGIKYSAGTFSICSSDSSNLSSTNPGWVTLRRPSGGSLITLKATANATFNDDAHASSDIVGEEFGTTTGVVWDEDRPFYIYAVNKDNTNANLLFAISPIPSLNIVPSSSTRIGWKGNPSSTSDDNSLWFLTGTDPSSYAGVPCVVIGAFRMRKSVSDDWTVQTLNSNYGEGIGEFYDTNYFTMPTGQMGASASTYFMPNGGTAPVFSTNYYRYNISRNGMVNIQISLEGDGGTDGAGAVDARIVYPIKLICNNYGLLKSTGFCYVYALTGPIDKVCRIASTVNNYFTLYSSYTTAVTLAAFSAGNRLVSINYSSQLSQS